MANPFLRGTDHSDIETAIMLEKAIVHDIGNAVAYTDGYKVFVNTDDNLFKILPAYDNNMLKWLLWHERMHMELRHHNRFFKYLSELEDEKCIDEFAVTKEEVNIIMDILVHDSLSKMFPELVETAVTNLAQFRDRNSLMHTFKTSTLEEMLTEYAEHKRGAEAGDTPGESESGDGKGSPADDTKDKEDKEDKEDKDTKDTTGEPTESKDTDTSEDSGKEDRDDGPTGAPHADEVEVKDDVPEPEPDMGHHSETDWSKLEDIDSKEFITPHESADIQRTVNTLKRKKIRLGRVTQTLNGLATSTRTRTYARPSPIHVGGGVIIKGSTPGRAKLYLCFDASGSMYSEMEMFKDIISTSIPQAMNTPCTWFSGYFKEGGPDTIRKLKDPDGRNYDYYKGTFKDFMPVHASSGYNDDGDRTIELCWRAEQLGYSPIGITDGGGEIGWAKKYLKQLKRTIFVGQCDYWLREAKEINPNIQTICTEED